MKILNVSLFLFLLPCMSSCTTVTTADIYGNSTKSVQLGSSQSTQQDPLIWMVMSPPSSDFQKAIASKNIFYHRQSDDTKPYLSTMNNSVSGKINNEQTVEIDLVLKADYNLDISTRYMIGFRFEKDTFVDKLHPSAIILTLYLDSQCITLSPIDVIDFSKVEIMRKTCESLTEQKKYRDFTAIDFFIDEQTMHSIVHSKNRAFAFQINDSIMINGVLNEDNEAIIDKFATVFSKINSTN